MKDHKNRQYWKRALLLQTDKLLKEAHDLVNNKRIGTCSAIEVPIQEVGEYELKLVLSLKE